MGSGALVQRYKSSGSGMNRYELPRLLLRIVLLLLLASYTLPARLLWKSSPSENIPIGQPPSESMNVTFGQVPYSSSSPSQISHGTFEPVHHNVTYDAHKLPPSSVSASCNATGGGGGGGGVGGGNGSCSCNGGSPCSCEQDSGGWAKVEGSRGWWTLNESCSCSGPGCSCKEHSEGTVHGGVLSASENSSCTCSGGSSCSCKANGQNTVKGGVAGKGSGGGSGYGSCSCEAGKPCSCKGEWGGGGAEGGGHGGGSGYGSCSCEAGKPCSCKGEWGGGGAEGGGHGGGSCAYSPFPH